MHPTIPNSFVFGTINGLVRYMRPIHQLHLNKAEIIFSNGNGAPIHWLSFSPNGRYLAIATDSNAAVVFCLKKSKLMRMSNDHAGFVRRVFFGEEDYVFSIGEDGNLNLYSMKDK